MEPTRQQIIDDIIREAHAAHGGRAAMVKHAIVEGLRDIEGSGVAWVGATLDDYLAAGAAKAYADWRRRYTVTAATAKGTEVEVPSFGAVLERDGSELVYVQLALDGMSLDQLKQRHARLSKQRNTLSREIQLLADLIALMEADETLVTAGDALARLEAA